MAEMDAILNSIPSSEQQAWRKARTESGKDSYLQLVPAVDQSIRLLFSLANTVGGEASLTQLTKEVGISKSKGLAILNTLRNAGLVTRNERTKNYRWVPNLLLLSRAFTNNTDLAQAATPYLEELAAETGCSTHLGVVSGETLFVVARRYAPGGYVHRRRRGAPLPTDLGRSRPGLPGHAVPEELESAPGTELASSRPARPIARASIETSCGRRSKRPAAGLRSEPRDHLVGAERGQRGAHSRGSRHPRRAASGRLPGRRRLVLA